MGAENETAGEGEGSGMNDKGGWRIKLFNLDFFQDFKKRKTFFSKKEASNAVVGKTIRVHDVMWNDFT